MDKGKPESKWTEEQLAQIEAIKEMAEVWMGFRTMGHVAIWLQKVLKYVGWAAGGLILYKGWAAGWFNVR